MLQFTDIQAAAARLQGHAHRTPVLTSRTLDAMLGAQVFMKAENLQRMGAFKFRGGYNAVNALSDAQRARGVSRSRPATMRRRSPSRRSCTAATRPS